MRIPPWRGSSAAACLCAAATAASAAAPPAPSLPSNSAMVVQSDPCPNGGPMGVSLGSSVITLALNFARRDADCSRIRRANAMRGSGYPAAGVQVLCEDPRNRAAMAQAGTPCEAVRASAGRAVP